MPEYQFPPPMNSKDFANLISDIFNEIYGTTTFKCYGKNGQKQKGIDIISVEKDIVIQCKSKDLTRNPSQVKKELMKDIDETIDFILTERPNIFFKALYIATTFSEHPDFDEYCEKIKEDNKLDFEIIFWG